MNEASQPIAFPSSGAAPGDQIGTLSVLLEAAAPLSSVASLTIDPSSATFSNQTGTVRETVSNDTLSLVNGSVTVNAAAPLATPSPFAAAATSTTNVDAEWDAVAGAIRYEIWRSVQGRPYTVIGTSTLPSLSDTNVVANTTYLYRVCAVDATGAASALSTVDPATTIFFTDDPLVANTTTIKAVHLTQLRAAVNAFRAAANLPALAADATVAAGAPVLAKHINDLRAALTAARSTAGVPAIAFTDPTLTPGTTLVRAAHVQDLRNGVK